MDDRVKQIDDKIAELKEQLNNVKGTECSIFSRITGFYQPLARWNRGKTEEYKHRKVYTKFQRKKD